MCVHIFMYIESVREKEGKREREIVEYKLVLKKNSHSTITPATVF